MLEFISIFYIWLYQPLGRFPDQILLACFQSNWAWGVGICEDALFWDILLHLGQNSLFLVEAAHQDLRVKSFTVLSSKSTKQHINTVAFFHCCSFVLIIIPPFNMGLFHSDVSPCLHCIAYSYTSSPSIYHLTVTLCGHCRRCDTTLFFLLPVWVL